MRSFLSFSLSLADARTINDNLLRLLNETGSAVGFIPAEAWVIRTCLGTSLDDKVAAPANLLKFHNPVSNQCCDASFSMGFRPGLEACMKAGAHRV